MEQERTTFKNIASLVRAKKVEGKRVKAAAALGLAGFNLNNSIHWPTLEASLLEHSAEIDEHLKRNKASYSELKEQKLIEEIEKLQLDNEKRRGRSIDPDDWDQFFADWGTELSTHIKKTRKDLMEQCPERAAVIDAAFIELFVSIRNREKCSHQ